MIAGIAVSPMNSGWPISQPRVPPACIRAPTVSCVPSGSPLTCNTCRMPVIDKITATPPAIRRGRCSGSGSVRIRMIATTTRAIGKTMASAPIQTRTASSATAPTGPAACNHDPIAHTTASAIRPKAMPSRRCTGSMSRVAAAPRPIARTALPSQRAPTSHSRFRPRPMPLIAVTIGEGSCGGWLGVREVARLPAAFVDPDRAGAASSTPSTGCPPSGPCPIRRRGSKRGPTRLRDVASRIGSRRAG